MARGTVTDKGIRIHSAAGRRGRCVRAHQRGPACWTQYAQRRSAGRVRVARGSRPEVLRGQSQAGLMTMKARVTHKSRKHEHLESLAPVDNFEVCKAVFEKAPVCLANEHLEMRQGNRAS
jgi:hypothetical protein